MTWRPPSQAPDPPSEIRILRLFSRLNVGGPAIHVILLTAGLEARGYRTRLVIGKESPREGNLLDLAVSKGVRCVELPTLGREIRPLADLRSLLALIRMVRTFRPHVVHTHTAKAGLLGRTAARVLGVPVVVHTYHGHVLRGYFGSITTSLFRGLERRLGRWSSVLVAVSESVKQDLVRLAVAAESKIRVVPLGLDLAPLTGELPRGSLRAEAAVAPGVPLIGIVGRLAPIKDLPTFLRAALVVREARPDARFAVVGDGEDRAALERQAQRLGLTGCLHFHGWRRDMAAVYGDIDVAVNCSLNEGTPVALIEALAAGRPVVATRVGGTPDLLGEGARGLLVPPADPGALAGSILDTLAHPEAARRRTHAGREYVLRQHSSERLIDDLDRIYRDLLALHARAA